MQHCDENTQSIMLPVYTDFGFWNLEALFALIYINKAF